MKYHSSKIRLSQYMNFICELYWKCIVLLLEYSSSSSSCLALESYERLRLLYGSLPDVSVSRPLVSIKYFTILQIN